MDEVLHGIPNCFTYIDDILVFSENCEEHLKHLSQVFNWLNHYGLILNKEKCIFEAPQLDFLGHRVSAEGVKPLDAKVEAIRDFLRPHIMQDLRKFLGIVNFYRRFIPNAGGLMAPLQCISSPKKTSRQKLTWGPEAEKAFQTVKDTLANSTMLAFPTTGTEISLLVDASTFAVGAVLQQKVEGHQFPLGFFSRALSLTQQNYSTFDRELLGIFLAIKYFRYFVEGHALII